MSARAAMVDALREIGVRDARLLAAMGMIPRELFLPAAQRDRAYALEPIVPALGEPLSYPFLIAKMIEALELEGGELVLEVGTGTGYQAALLSRLAARVVSIEIVPELAESARARLAKLGLSNVA